MAVFIHPLSDVQSSQIGDNTKIWQYVVVLSKAVIGANCNINCHVFIENDVVIGNNVTIKSGVYVWDGVTIHDNVFIGPNVTFTNDTFPRSKKYPDKFGQTIIKNFASIGANATILSNLTIGSYSLTGAGSVVTRSVPDYALVVGNPAKVVGWVDKSGEKLVNDNGLFISKMGNRFKVENNCLIEV